MFAKHGIPEILMSDNATQYKCQEMADFASEWGFQQITSSPLYLRSNGLAKKTVQTAKHLLEKAKQTRQDPYLALLNYRNTPIKDVGSPAQLLMNRRLRSTVPASPKQLLPEVIPPTVVMDALKEKQRRQKMYYDRGTRPLGKLNSGDTVLMYNDGTWKPATVTSQAPTPRSYNITTPEGGRYRRNRQQLQKIGRAHV